MLETLCTPDLYLSYFPFLFTRISFVCILIYKHCNLTSVYRVIVSKQLSYWLHHDGVTGESSAHLGKYVRDVGEWVY